MASERILDQHEVGAAVVACIDFRFRENLASAIHTTFSIDAYDEIKIAGGAKNFSRPGKAGRHETALHDLELAINAHRAHTVILLTHQNCGKYASEGHSFADDEDERKFHIAELRTAGKIVQTQFPNVTVLLGYTYVNDSNAVQIERIPF